MMDTDIPDSLPKRLNAASLNGRVRNLKFMLLGLFGIILFRIIWIQLIMPAQYITRVDSFGLGALGNENTILEQGYRGQILDVEGRPFTAQKMRRRVQLEPKSLLEKEKTPLSPEVIQGLADILHDTFPEVIKQPSIDYFYVPSFHGKPIHERGVDGFRSKILLSKEFATEDWNRLYERAYSLFKSCGVKESRLNRILYDEKVFRRYYVEGDMLCHVIGRTGPKQIGIFKQWSLGTSNPKFDSEVQADIGISGIERVLDDRLRFAIGYRRSTFNPNRNFRQARLEPYDGDGVVLTIDKVVQGEVEKELKSLVSEYRPESAVIIITRPYTGEIVALAGAPGFDLNDTASNAWYLPGYRPVNEKEILKNESTFAFSDIIPPGSTFKPLIIGAALETGRLSENARIDCPHKYPEDYKFPVKESGYSVLGVVPWQKVISESSNTGTARIMKEHLTFPVAYEFIRKLGFGRITSPFLYGEVPGNIRRGEDDYRVVDHYRVAIGQSISVTGIQMMMAYGCLANGGYLYEPRLIDRFIRAGESEPDSLYENIAITEGVYSDRTCRLINQAMVDVVEDGTGTSVKMDNYLVAGKTGTAEILGQEGKRLKQLGHRAYISSFIGFIPGSEPVDPTELKARRKERLCIGVWVKAPRGAAYYGGVVAGPTFKRISEFLVRHYRIEPDRKDKSLTLNQSR